jgi:hypothetical protein
MPEDTKTRGKERHFWQGWNAKGTRQYPCFWYWKGPGSTGLVGGVKMSSFHVQHVVPAGE